MPGTDTVTMFHTLRYPRIVTNLRRDTKSGLKVCFPQGGSKEMGKVRRNGSSSTVIFQLPATLALHRY